MARWTGNGLANGVAITAGNVNTAGNGDTVVRGVSGTPPVFSTEGDGFRVSGSGSYIARLDSGSGQVSGFGGAAQCFFTPNGAPSATETPIVFRNSSGDIARLALSTARLFRPQNAAAANAGSGSSAWVDGHKYQIDMIAQVKTSGASTTNGRIVCQIIDLTDPTWNSGGFWYDSGETLNLGTAQLNSTQAIRFGKQVNATVPPTGGYLFENIGWASVSLPAATTSRGLIEGYFLKSPYRPTIKVRQSSSSLSIPKLIIAGEGEILRGVVRRSGASVPLR